MVEKFYKIKNNRLEKEVIFFREENKKRNELIRDFFEKHGIVGTSYYMSADGLFNRSVEEYKKSGIRLCIGLENTEKFADQTIKNSICPETIQFKKSSKILKDFQQECVNRQVVINLQCIEMGLYFKELRYGGYSTDGLHEKDGFYYLKISTSKFDSITPAEDGFEEIKGSEYYTVKESID